MVNELRESSAGKAIPSLFLKGNQRQLQQAVQRLFRTGAAERGGSFDDYERRERGHGREETRRYWITGEIEELWDLYCRPGLRSIGKVEATRTLEGKTTAEQRFSRASLEADAQAFARAVHAHWGLRTVCIGPSMSLFMRIRVSSARAAAPRTLLCSATLLLTSYARSPVRRACLANASPAPWITTTC